MLANARKDHSISLLLILFVLICRYAATGSCNIFVFIVTWVLLDTSESSTSSDKLGSADASAFMVSKLCSLLYPDTKCCEWIWSRGAFLSAVWVRHAISWNAWQAQTAGKKHRHFTIQTRFTDKFHSLSSIEVHSKLLWVHYEVGFRTSWHCQQTMKSVGIQCLLIIYQLCNQNSIYLLM